MGLSGLGPLFHWGLISRGPGARAEKGRVSRAWRAVVWVLPQGSTPPGPHPRHFSLILYTNPTPDPNPDPNTCLT